MTLKKYAGDKITGVSGDTKPTNVGDGATFYETDTKKIYIKVSGSWQEVDYLPNSTTDPPGSITATVRATPNTGCLFLDGTLVVGAASTYPNLWAVIPVSWKSGSDMQLPDWRTRALFGAGTGFTLGASGGSNTVTIASGNLPVHTHAIDHDHASVTSGSNSVDHTHSIAHDHGSVTSGGESAGHTHTFGATSGGISANHYHAHDGNSIGGSGSLRSIPWSTTGSTGYVSSDHTHYSSGTTGTISADHTHTVDLPNFTG
ncbi:MAG: hypothetical protein AAB624_02630, partial [Patescibacteria group bacterium]